jgi:ribonuclease HI
MQGCGQGDVPSSCIWTAVADILLTALESVTHGAFYFQDATGRNHPASAIAYCDDTADVTGTHQALQDKADIYCAFAAILGFSVSIAKMRVFSPNSGNEHRISPEYIVIHDKHWTPLQVCIRTDGTCKQLGVQWDLDHTNTIEFDKAHTRLTRDCDRILSKSGTAEMKYTALRGKTIMAVTYYLQFQPWSLKQYQLLDDIIIRTYKKITLFMPSAANDMMHIDTRDSGMGMLSLVDFVHHCKLSLLNRMSLTDDRTALAMSSLISRGFRTSGTPLTAESRHALSVSSICSIWWITSLIEWLGVINCEIFANGSIQQTQADSSIADLPLFVQAHITALSRVGIATKGELLMEGDLEDQLSKVQAAVTLISPFTQLLPVASIYPCALAPVSIRVGQCWMREGSQDILDIVGFIGDQHIDYILWRTYAPFSNRELAPVASISSTVYQWGDENFPRGAGSDNRISFSDFYCPQTRMALVNMLPDSHSMHIASGTPYNSCRIFSIVNRVPRLPNTQRTRLPPSNNDYIHLAMSRVTEIYTDGSYAQQGSVADYILGTTVNKAAAGIVLRQDGMVRSPTTTIRITCDEPHLQHSAYYFELLSICAMFHYAHSQPTNNISISTDCNSAKQAVERARLSRVKYGDNVMLLSALRYYRYCELRHVKAHMDKKVPKLLLSADNIGNAMADSIAGDLSSVDITVTDSFMAEKVVSVLPFYIRDSTTHSPLVESLKRRLSRYRIQKYLRN